MGKPTISGEMPLSMVSEGEKVKIKKIDAGHQLQNRLRELGLVKAEDVVIEVIKNEFSGPMILKVFDSRIVIGRGQANKIYVEKIQSEH